MCPPELPQSAPENKTAWGLFAEASVQIYCLCVMPRLHQNLSTHCGDEEMLMGV